MGPHMTATSESQRIQSWEANIARMKEALLSAEGARRELLEIFIESGQQALKELKRRVWH